MSILDSNSFTKKYKTPFEKFEINTTLRLAHFMGQVTHESPGLKGTREGFNYSTEALKRLFKSHRITQQQISLYGRTSKQPANQKMIANIIYGGEWGRINLGNIKPTDGWDFRGGGILQITGRANYTKLSKDTGIDFVTDPNIIIEEANSLIAALWYWNMRKLNIYADKDNVDAVSDLINLGKRTPAYGDAIGFEDRETKVKYYKNIFK